MKSPEIVKLDVASINPSKYLLIDNFSSVYTGFNIILLLLVEFFKALN